MLSLCWACCIQAWRLPEATPPLQHPGELLWLPSVPAALLSPCSTAQQQQGGTSHASAAAANTKGATCCSFLLSAPGKTRALAKCLPGSRSPAQGNPPQGTPSPPRCARLCCSPATPSTGSTEVPHLPQRSCHRSKARALQLRWGTRRGGSVRPSYLRLVLDLVGGLLELADLSYDVGNLSRERTKLLLTALPPALPPRPGTSGAASHRPARILPPQHTAGPPGPLCTCPGPRATGPTAWHSGATALTILILEKFTSPSSV